MSPESKPVWIPKQLPYEATSDRCRFVLTQLIAQTARVGLIDTEISRLRSVIYLLVKDEPDMLRLLIQPNPGESRPQG
jgi:hypothetical protein